MTDHNASSYFEDFQNSIRAAATTDESFTEQVFIEEMSRRLSEAEEVDSLIPTHYQGMHPRSKKLLRVDGYDLGDEEGQIVLAVAHYSVADETEAMGLTDARKLFGMLDGFLDSALDGSLVAALEESSDAFQLADEIAKRAPGLDKVRLYLLTNNRLGDKIKEFPTRFVGGVAVEYHLWDIERMRRVETSQSGREEIDIDLTEWIAGGLPALEVVSKGSGLTTYLAVVPGAALAGIYRKYGGRVLEANVRSFLSTRGNVNKGIRGTVLQQPNLFLAYNNGISATASAVVARSSDGATRLTNITDLQIVNGGQTTASLFYTQKGDSADLSEVHVQMKLIVVDSDRATELVPKISRYANTQNRVSEADFFSNHPFHVRMEEKSRRLLVPARAGSAYQTKWFYERTRGQFLNERAKVSAAQAKRFEAEYPRVQMITKTDAAKYLVSWDGKPHTVSSGAQKNFLAFATSISAAWAANDLQFGDDYFKDLVAKGILFNSLRARVMKSDWYSTGYLANIVTYAIARVSAAAGPGGSRFDLARVWREQGPSEMLLDDLEAIAASVAKFLTADDRPVTNVTEWAKREAAWRGVLAIPVVVGPGLSEYLRDREDQVEAKTAAKRLQKLDSGIVDQIAVTNLGSRYWVRLRDFGQDMRSLNAKDKDLIRYGTGESGRLPSEAQATYLMQLSARMEAIGFVGK
jgi:hypothetical protein